MPGPGDDLCLFIREYLSTALAAEGMDGPQVSAILDELDQTMRHEYGGDDHYIPAIDKKRRNKALMADWKAGMQIEDLAIKYRINKRTVYRVVNQRPKINRQSGAGLGTEEWVL